MKEHAAEYRRLPLREKLDLRDKALRFDRERMQKVRLEMQDLKLRKKALDADQAKRIAEADTPNHVGECRLTDQELTMACNYFDSSACKSLRVEEYLGAYGSAPKEPTTPERKCIDDIVDSLDQGREKNTWWSRMISRNRDDFHCTAIGLEEDGELWWLVLFAKQQPFQTTFLQLRRRARVLDLTSDARYTLNRREYDYLPPTIRDETNMPFGDEVQDLYVRTDGRFIGRVVCFPHRAEAFEMFLLFNAKHRTDVAAPPKQRAKRPRDPASREKFLLDNPWLSDDDVPGGTPKRRQRGGNRSPRGRRPIDDGLTDDEPDSRPPPPPPPLEDEEPVEPISVHDELKAIREEMAWEDNPLRYFYTKPLGGGWTKENRGKAADRYGGWARSMAKEWCEVFSFPKEKTYSFVLKFEPDDTKYLSREYCRRGEYFYRLFLKKPDITYSRDVIESYVESEEFVRFMCACDVDGPAFDAGLKLRKIYPREI